MQEVKIKKVDLVKILKDNRKKHRDEFEKALQDYKVAIVGLLEDRLKEAKEGRKVNHYIEIVIPQDQTKDYDRAIRMLELEVDKTVVLKEEEFSQLVEDQWGWKNQFSVSNAVLHTTALSYQ